MTNKMKCPFCGASVVANLYEEHIDRYCTSYPKHTKGVGQLLAEAVNQDKMDQIWISYDRPEV